MVWSASASATVLISVRKLRTPAPASSFWAVAIRSPRVGRTSGSGKVVNDILRSGVLLVAVSNKCTVWLIFF